MPASRLDYEFRLQLGDWSSLDEATQSQIVARFVRALVDADTAWMTRGDRWKRLPLLYASGVRFQREADGAPNLWQNVPLILESREGHCVGLTAWRLAELALRFGERAYVRVDPFEEQRPRIGRVQEFHVSIQYVDGRREDPARRLGMP